MSDENNLEVKRTERGWAGHFICASNCTFRRNTLLEIGALRVVVSTVGGYHSPHKEDTSDGGCEEIGYERHYETMAFEATFEEPYWEANVHHQIRFGSGR